jgi:hypothetical protein
MRRPGGWTRLACAKEVVASRPAGLGHFILGAPRAARQRQQAVDALNAIRLQPNLRHFLLGNIHSGRARLTAIAA